MHHDQMHQHEAANYLIHLQPHTVVAHSSPALLLYMFGQALLFVSQLISMGHAEHVNSPQLRLT